MTRKLTAVATALGATLLFTATAADAAKAPKVPNAYVDMDNSRSYTPSDIVVSPSGKYKTYDNGKIMTGSMGGVASIIVANGKDLYLSGKFSGQDLVLATHGGNVYVADGTQITVSGQFALGSTTPAKGGPAGDLVIGKNVVINHAYKEPPTRVFQIIGDDITIGDASSIQSLPKKAKQNARSAATSSVNAFVKATGRVSMAPTASVSGVPIIEGAKG